MGNEPLIQEIDLYLQIQLPLIPLKPQSKDPLVRWGDIWNPTSEGLERRFANHSVNISVRCRDKVAVVGCDPEEVFRNFRATCDLLSGCRVIEADRGYYIWGKPRKPVRSQRINSVEVKCLGSHVVAPPPIHPTGTAHVFQVAPGTARDFTEAYRVSFFKSALLISDTAKLKIPSGLEVIR